MNKRRKRLSVSLPIDPEDIEKMFPNPNSLYGEKLLKERERRFDANMLAVLNNQPIPYPAPPGMLDDDICPECGQDID